MSQGPLCPNLSQKVQTEVSQMANHNLSRMILLGGLSVNLNHLKTEPYILSRFISIKKEHCALLTTVIIVVMTMVS